LAHARLRRRADVGHRPAAHVGSRARPDGGRGARRARCRPRSGPPRPGPGPAGHRRRAAPRRPALGAHLPGAVARPAAARRLLRRRGDGQTSRLHGPGDVMTYAHTGAVRRAAAALIGGGALLLAGCASQVPGTATGAAETETRTATSSTAEPTSTAQTTTDDAEADRAGCVERDIAADLGRPDAQTAVIRCDG